MASLSFQSIVRNNLGFLLSDYGYQIKFIDTSDPLGEDGAAYIYSERTIIYILKSRFDYMITLMPVGEPEFTQMSVLWILKALSVAPKDFQSRKSDIDTFNGYVSFYAELIKKYCIPFIKGDYSEWLRVLGYFVNESKTEYYRRTGRQMPERVHHDLVMYIKNKRLKGR